MAGSRIKDITGSQSTFEKELVLLVDRVDTGSGDWLQARKLELGLLGNTYYQGSSNGINWHDELLSTDTYFRLSTDGGSTWRNLTTDLVREGLNNLYYTESRVSSNIDVAANSTARHTHTNLSLLENIIDSGTGNYFLADDGTYKSPATLSVAFTDLLDSPSSYTGFSGYAITVNATEDGVEFTAASGTGTVTSVTSLTTDQLTVGGVSTINPQLSIVTGAVVDLGTALATGDQIYDFVTGQGYITDLTGFTTTDLTEGTNLYYTEARVSANTDVTANTAARHDAVTVLDSSEIDFTLTGQQITASLITGSIDVLKLDAGVQASLALADSATQPGDLATVATTGDHTDLLNIGTNTHAQIDSHIAGTGADHSYIDQDVTTTSSPTFIEVSTDGINFDPTTPPSVTSEGTVWWNGDEYTLNMDTGLGPTLQIGQETYILYYNNTGSLISNLSVLHLFGGDTYNGYTYPTPELADASDWSKCQGTLAVATQDIANGSLGFAVLYGRARGGDTSGLVAGSQIWLSASTPGALTSTKPEFPNYSISMGGAFNSAAAPNGEILVSITKDVYDTFNDAWDGSIRETFDFRITSNGTTITGSLENADLTNDLTLIFSDDFYTLDVTPAATLTLTAGTATVPQVNYIFIDKATKTLQTSTSGFPTAEHAKVAKVALLDAASTQTYGALRNQNINDHLKSTNDNGHILHMAERIRTLNAEWESGVAATLTGTTTNVYINTTSGVVYQMHPQTFPAQSMSTGDDIHVVNDPTTPYRNTTNLNDITVYSDGNTWNNEWSNIVVWGIANKTGEESHLMVNLPSAGYTSEAAAVADANNYSNYSIPKIFKGVGFLIARFTIRRSSTTFTYNSGTGYLDLRGYFPNNTAGGGTGSSGVTEFTQLTDTPSSYSGAALQVVRVNAGETALEFFEAGGGDVVGPASAVNNNLVAFDGTTGKLIKDSGILLTNVFDKSTDDMDDITDGVTYVKYSAVEQTKLAGIESGAEVNNISDIDATDLTDGGDSTLHYHASDRARANHTGTQTASTISDFDTEVSNNTDVAANTTARHDAVTIAAGLDYITLVGQQLTLNNIDLTTDVTGILPDANVANNITLTNITQIINRSHTDLSDIGTNSHATIDIHLASTSNPHSVVANQVNITDTGAYYTGTEVETALQEIGSDISTLQSSSHSPVTIGTANGLSLSTQQLSLALASTSTTGALSSTDWNTFNGKQNALTFGISNTNTVVIDSGTIADNDYAKFTLNGLEGRSYAEVKVDLSLNNVENTAISTWTGSGNIATVGTITSGVWNGTALGANYVPNHDSLNGFVAGEHFLQTAITNVSTALSTGLLKVTTGTGLLSTAVAGTDYQTPLTPGADYLRPSVDVDDTPVNAQTSQPISSNWAYDHAIGQTVNLHTVLGTVTTGNIDAISKEVIGIALSDPTTDLSTGTGKYAFDMPYNFVATRVYASVITAPTGSSLQVDINDEGTTILNSVLTIAVSTNNVETSTFTGSTSSYTFTKGDAISFDIDQIGSTVAGAGLVVFIEGTRS